MSQILARTADWLWGRKLPRAEELRVRMRAMRGKSVEDFERELLEDLYAKSPDA